MNALSLIERLFGWIWQTTWQAAVIALIIILTQYLLRNRLSPAWRHGLWFLLVARLLMPMTPGSAVSIFNVAKLFQGRPAQVVVNKTQNGDTPTVAVLPLPDGGMDSAPVPRIESRSVVSLQPGIARDAQRNTSFQTGSVVSLQPVSRRFVGGMALMSSFWFMGVLFLGVRFVWLNRRFNRRLAVEPSIVDPSVHSLFNQCAQAMGISQRVQLMETNAVDSPAVFGVFRKWLLLPCGLCGQLSAGELRHVLLHELAHVKRRDPELNWLLAALQILHWFNPVLWLAFSRIRTDRELATDDLALAWAGHSERLTYGDTIVKVLEGMTQRRLSPGLVGIAESKADIQQRIRAIAGGGGPPWRLGAFAVAVVMAGLVLTGASENTTKPIKLVEQQPTGDTNCARVVSVSPADGATDVEPMQELRIRFDRPMDPHHLKLDWQTGGFQLNGSIQVTPDQMEFIIPVRMTPRRKQTLVVNYDPEGEMWRRSGGKSPRPNRPGFMDGNSIPANEYRWSFLTRPRIVAEGAVKPRVVSISPPSGPAPMLSLVQITFDQPMQPPDDSLPYLQKKTLMGGPSLIPSIDYDGDAHRFTLPALLPAGDDARLVVAGLYGANGAKCDPVVIHYQTDTQTYDPKYKAKAAASAKDPALIKLFTSMKEARARLNSGVETVQTLHLGLETNAYNSIEGQTATFKWQGSDQAYCDISGPMEMGTFILGCDGQNCWVYSDDDGKGGKRLDQTPVAVTEREIIMVDPFGLGKRSVAKALASQPFVLESSADLDGHSCCRVEVWQVSKDGMDFATKTQWWIDQETFLPKQYVQYHPFGCEIVRFDYSHLNEPLPDSAFQPPPTRRGEAHPVFFEKGPAPGEHRFLIICDGSNGRMSGRIGWNDSHGSSTDSGMN